MSSPSGKKSETGVKDTIESILVAFILAFIFRCFVIEAFVIPTGSMAPTLLGAHMDFRCPDCGYRFSVGYPTTGNSFSIADNAAGTYNLYCPNCGFNIPKQLPSDPDHDATEPPLKFGDRILVMKYLNLFGDEPKRWDVVVFKSPDTTTGDYSVNFIKRLIGRPGESLFVGQGDIYVARPGTDPKNPDSYTVQTKPRWVQDVVWRIIFDADHVPQSRGQPRDINGSWHQPWQQTSGNGWLNDLVDRNISPRQFVFDNLQGSGTLSFNPLSNPNASGFNDKMAYNQIGNVVPSVAAGDLKLEFFFENLIGEGTLQAVLTRQKNNADPGDTFIAEVSTGQIRLLLQRNGQTTEISRKNQDLSGIHHLSIENVDYRVSVYIDGRLVLSTTPEQYSPDVRWVISHPYDFPIGSARIQGDRVRTTLRHVKLWRDNIYRGADMPGVQRAFANGNLDHVVTLGEHEYFVMGDNSPHSKDGRLWEENTRLDLPEEHLQAGAGVVPERFMLGKAFFVYWPSGYKLPILPIRAVPNFGDMRFIR